VAEHFTEVSEKASADAGSGGVRSRAVRANVLARRSDYERAEELARDAVTLAETDDRLNVQGDAYLDLAEVLWLAGQGKRVVPVVEQALRQYEQKENLVSASKARVLLDELETASNVTTSR
jgi:hypothetical protein